MKMNSNHEFKKGQKYENKIGKYEVIELTHEKMRVQYENGIIEWLDIKTQQRIWERIKSSQPKAGTAARINAVDQRIIDAFAQALIGNKRFRDDTVGHAEGLEYWDKKIFQNLSTVNQADLLEAVSRRHIMIFGASNITYLEECAGHPDFKRFLRLVKEAARSDAQSVRAVFDGEHRANLKGIGPFFISQLLAAAHPGEFTIMGDEKNYVPKTLQYLGVTDQEIDIIGSFGKYLEANDLCIRLYDLRIGPLLAPVCKSFSISFTPHFKASVMHNFTYHYGRYVHPKNNLEPQYWFYDD